MYLHANAKLGLAGRFALVRAIDEGMTLKAAHDPYRGSESDDLEASDPALAPRVRPRIGRRFSARDETRQRHGSFGF